MPYDLKMSRLTGVRAVALCMDEGSVTIDAW